VVSRICEVALLPDPKDVEILRSGPRAWNAWRENNPSTVPDLTGIALSLSERQMGPINGGPINLKSARLQGAFLRFATLSTADLEAADMSDADFMHARFDRANLSAANLSNARLDHADLGGATLTKVNLCGASLQHAILSTADLEAADMSDADFMHARFDRANLSAANLTDARLDHADFAGANLTKANLSGASLQHAKNLTESQLKESTGSGSTILPPHLRGSVSWSVARIPTEIERHDVGPRVPLPAEADVSQIGSHAVQRWRVGALFIGVTLVISAFVWQHMNEVVPLDTSGAQRGSESFLAQPKPSLDTGNQGLPPSAPEALMEEKAAAEGRPSADAEIPPSVASTVDQTETTPEKRPTPETNSATVPQETNAKAELQASHGAKPSAEAFGSREHVAGTPEPGDDSALVSAESPPAPSRHAIVPDLPAAAPPDPQAAEQPAEVVAANTPDLSAPSKAPDSPAEAATPELQDPQAAEQPAEAVAVNTPEQHLDASPPNYTALPPVTTAPPSVDVTALPTDAEIVPKPFRKPVIQKPVGELAIQKPTTAPPSVDVTALPHDAEIVPKPIRKPVIQNPAGKPVIQKPVTKPVNQRTEVDSKPAPRHRAKDQSFFDEEVRSAIADLLAGGL
jgi:uncharacterized protein YjbI with pentapeptide repeats